MPTSPNGLHVVLGASGGIGAAVVRELVARGRRVRAVNRRGQLPASQGVETLGVDLASPAGARQACAGAGVVYHCAQPGYRRWSQELLPMAEAVLEGAAAAGAKLVLADNLYLYGPVAGPMTEDLPAAATNPKGRVRAEQAELLLGAHRAGRVRVALGRASDYFGPGGVNTVNGPTIFAAALAGRTARWIGPLDIPHSVSYLPDIASGLILLGDHDEADGQAWHLPAAEPVTGRQFLELVFAQLDRPAKLAGLSRSLQRTLGLVNPTVRELGETWYQRDRPFILDATKFQQAFGPRPPPLTPTPSQPPLTGTVTAPSAPRGSWCNPSCGEREEWPGRHSRRWPVVDPVTKAGYEPVVEDGFGRGGGRAARRAAGRLVQTSPSVGSCRPPPTVSPVPAWSGWPPSATASSPWS